MEQPPPNAALTLAFLTVVDITDVGTCGGMLVLNQLGRPVEFHCSAPVQPNRTQQVLFGPTLKSFIYCDQVGSALLDQVKKKPDIVLVDQVELLDLHAQTAIPIIAVRRQQAEIYPRVEDGKTVQHEKLENFFLTGIVNEKSGEDWLRACQIFAEQLPLDEPFERIRQAIDEAQAVAR
jgi:hypothetical protein